MNRYERTTCDCSQCQSFCRHMPGALAPGDAEKIAKHLNYSSVRTFAAEHLEPSAGALVLYEGRLTRVPSLVPASGKDGACHWLTSEGRCEIHEVAPTGCAYFDDHLTVDDAQARSQYFVWLCFVAWRSGASYATLWLFLAEALGRPVVDPEERRRRLELAAVVS